MQSAAGHAQAKENKTKKKKSRQLRGFMRTKKAYGQTYDFVGFFFFFFCKLNLVLTYARMHK